MTYATVAAALFTLAVIGGWAAIIWHKFVHDPLLRRLEAQRERDAAYRHAMRKMGRAA